METSQSKHFGGASHNHIYWKYWLILVAILLILRFSIFLSSGETARFFLFIAFAAVTWIPTALIFAYETRRHLLYLQAWFPQIPPRGPLVYPYILRIKSFVSKEELENPAVQAIIARYRGFVRFMWVEFICFAVLYVVVMLDREALAALVEKVFS
jgi:hypothetical protein